MTPKNKPVLRLGTRASPLALVQAGAVRDALLDTCGGLGDVEIVKIRTSGDKITDRTLLAAGGKGLFTKEIEEGLLEGRIDLAVHSGKDMPTALPAGLVLAAFLPRADARDCLVSNDGLSLDELPEGARVGTASVRRRAQILARRPDLDVLPVRGNLDTRLEKLAAGKLDAIVLAMAGLIRLGRLDSRVRPLDPEILLPAAAQGIITIEAAEDAADTLGFLKKINDRDAALAAAGERACLAALDGSCRTPIAIHAGIEGDAMTLRCRVMSPDGRFCHADSLTGAAGDAANLGRELGARVRADIGEGQMQAIRAAVDALDEPVV